MKITGHTDIVGIFGDPLTYTLSPVFQNAGFQAKGLNCLYLPFPSSGKDLPRLWSGLACARNFIGANVTIPHKIIAMKFADQLTPQANAIGAINTLYRKGDKWIGHNTDGDGFKNALRRGWGKSLKGKNVLILGSGGAARGVAWAASCAQAEVLVAGYDMAEAKRLAKNFKKVGVVPFEDKLIGGLFDSTDVIVNTVPFPAVGRRLGKLLPKVKNKSRVLFDITYDPPLSPLLKAGKTSGWKVLNGLPMLLEQGILSYECWTGKKAPREEMRRALGSAFVS